jgi:hypothetical protein
VYSSFKTRRFGKLDLLRASFSGQHHKWLRMKMSMLRAGPGFDRFFGGPCKLSCISGN